MDLLWETVRLFWLWLCEPVYGRWWGLVLVLWWASGKPELPVARWWARFKRWRYERWLDRRRG